MSLCANAITRYPSYVYSCSICLKLLGTLVHNFEIISGDPLTKHLSLLSISLRQMTDILYSAELNSNLLIIADEYCG